MTTCAKQRGVSLLEVLVTIVVLGIGMAGVANMILTGVRGTHAAQTRSQATILADKLADTMRANLVAYESSEFAADPESTESNCSGGSECEADIQAQFDVARWKTLALAALPAGQATICMDSSPDDGQPGALACDGNGYNTVKVFWRDNRHGGELAEGESFHRLVVTVVP